MTNWQKKIFDIFDLFVILESITSISLTYANDITSIKENDMNKIIEKIVDDFKNSNKEYIVCSRLYKIYIERCIKANEKPMEHNWFGRRVKKELKRKQIYKDKKRVWVYAKLSSANHQHMLETSPAQFDIDKFCELAKELFYHGKEDFDDFVRWYRDWVREENLKEQWGQGNNS